MPTNRRYKGHRAARALDLVFDEAKRVHVELTDCTLAGFTGRACACGLRREDGTEDFQAIADTVRRLSIPRELVHPDYRLACGFAP